MSIYTKLVVNNNAILLTTLSKIIRFTINPLSGSVSKIRSELHRKFNSRFSSKLKAKLYAVRI
jgi:hypothetical protein